MEISVAMCTYNGASFLPEQLESIATQNRLPDELIICDDHSSDETRDILNDFAAQASFPVRLVFNEENIGTVNNFEQSISLCKGDVIVLADQDDVWYPHKLMRFDTVFSRQPAVGLVFTDADMVDENLTPTGTRLWQHTFKAHEQEQFRGDNAFRVLLERNVVTGATMAFRADYKDLILPIPTDVPRLHDGWIALMIAAVAPVRFIAEPLIKYRQHPRQQRGVQGSGTALAPQQGTNSLRSMLHRDYCYLSDISRLKIFYNRLLSNSHTFDSGRSMRLLKRHIDHYVVRDKMPASRVARTLVVFDELRAGNYHQFSKGLRSIVKDLLC
jgi:glycosyltransferase involved in cell wall biosynthesis